MKTKKMTATLLVALSCLTGQAQKLSGISVDAGQKEVVVLLNGQAVCEPTHSCFIANLAPGTYKIDVYYGDEMDRHPTERERLYYEKIKYDGFSVKKINVRGRYDDYDNDYYGPQSRDLISNAEFRDLCHSLKDAHFDDDRLKLLETLPRYTKFTSKQCRDIAEIFSFDDNKVKVLEMLYPRVVDPVSFHIAVDELDFNSNKDKVYDWIKSYNRRRR